MSLELAPALMREAPCKSHSDQGRGTKWSGGFGGGLEVWEGGGLRSGAVRARQGGAAERRRPTPCGGQTASGTWAGTAHHWARRTAVDAGDNGLSRPCTFLRYW